MEMVRGPERPDPGELLALGSCNSASQTPSAPPGTNGDNGGRIAPTAEEWMQIPLEAYGEQARWFARAYRLLRLDSNLHFFRSEPHPLRICQP